MTLNKDYAFERIYQSLNLSATIKTFAEDFVVEEFIPIEFIEEGEHCWIYVEKRDCNTDWVAQQLASYCDVKKMAVSYAGLKDRRAMTSQWFSVQMPGLPTPEWDKFETQFNSQDSDEKIRVLKSVRHNRKLQRGALKGNKFTITLRDLSDTSEAMFESLLQRCQAISQHGVANYFGSQRFGRERNNLDAAIKIFSNSRYKLSKHKRSIYLSAARSWMFNFIVSERIKMQCWDKRLSGDVFMLDGKSACFKDDASSEISSRLDRKEIHPTAPLWGDGDMMVEEEAKALEMRIVDQFPVYRDGLVSARVQGQRRACRVIPSSMEGSREGDNFILTFTLPAGSYATEVLAEIISSLTVSR